MKIDTSTKEGRKLAIIYEVVKNGISEGFRPHKIEDAIWFFKKPYSGSSKDAYIGGKDQAYWDIKELIEAEEFERKKIKEV